MEKYSKQKEEIYNFIKITKNQPTAEEIYQKLNENNSRVSRGTIYRNLNLLVEKNIIKRISIPNHPDRFDFVCDKSCNYAICIECGKVFTFHYPIDNEKLKQIVFEETDLQSFSNELTIYGICNLCNLNKNKI